MTRTPGAEAPRRRAGTAVRGLGQQLEPRAGAGGWGQGLDSRATGPEQVSTQRPVRRGPQGGAGPGRPLAVRMGVQWALALVTKTPSVERGELSTLMTQKGGRLPGSKN